MPEEICVAKKPDAVPSRPGVVHRLSSVLRSGLVAIGALWLLVTVTPLDSWLVSGLRGPWNDNPSGDTLIVLAGAGGEGVIGYGTYLRCQYAIYAWRGGKFRQILVSGGSQAKEMRDFLVGEGIPASVIAIEAQSHSTRENALFSRAALQGAAGTKVLLTSDYHMFRAVRAFRKAGLDVVPCPFPDVGKHATTWQGRWPAFLDLVVESAKIVYYRARSWI